MYRIYKSNIPVYNIVLLIEFTGYALFFNRILTIRWLKRVTAYFLIIFLLFWFVSVFIVFGIFNWNSYVYVIGSLFTICLAICYYYQLIKSSDINSLKRNSEFWISTGLIIFFATNLPYMGMYNFLTVNYPDLANNFGTLLLVLNIIMYSMFAYAFLCRIRINTEKLLL
jgi:4-amino-4-deoxy-L-arabinose transferase-like glycosyltransferase